MSAIVHKINHLMSFNPLKKYPENWENEDWIPVPTVLEDKLLRLFPNCELEFNEGKTELLDIIEKQTENQRDPTYYPDKLESIYVIVKNLMPAAQLDLNNDDKIRIGALIEDWVPGDYKIGDLTNIEDQIWECHQAHNNSEHPDITPENPQTWATFWKPLHGTTPRTARKWVKPQYGTTSMYHWVKPQYGTTDMYHIGEYMWYTDNKLYKCIQDTNFSPDEYAHAWEVQK